MLTVFTLFLSLSPAPQEGNAPQEEAAPARAQEAESPVGSHAEWNQFRGPGGRGVARDAAEHPPENPTRYPTELDSGKELLWEAALPPGHSSPVLYGENVFVTGFRNERLETLCLDRESGEVRWRRALEPTGSERLHRVNSEASATPATDGERVYAYFGTFGLIAYNVDGEEVWRRPLEAPNNTFGSAASPVLANGRLLFLHDANDGSFVEAINPVDGATLWRRERTDFKSGWSTPTVWERDGRLEVLVYGVWWLTAYDFETGEELWSVPGLTDEPIVMPAAGEGLVFVTSYNMKTNTEVIGLPEFAALVEELDQDGDGSLDAKEAEANESVLSRHDADGEGDHPLRIFFRFLDEDRDGEITSTEWKKIVEWVDGFAHANGVIAIRPAAGEGDAAEIAWSYPHGVPECPSPLFYEGRIYLVKNGGLVTCLDARTGALEFQERLDARGPWYSSPVAAGGCVYAASARGVVTVFEAAGELRVKGQVDLGERIMATPALSAGVVYVRTESRLLAFARRE